MKPKVSSLDEYRSRVHTQHSWMMRGTLFVLAPESVYHWASVPTGFDQDEFLRKKRELAFWIHDRKVESHTSGWTFWIAINDPKLAVEFKLIFC